MSQSSDPRSTAPGRIDRRGWLRLAIGLILGSITSVVAVIVGGAVVSPGLAGRRTTWVRAGRLRDLEDDVPVPVTLRIAREDGYYEAVDQQVVFLIKSESGSVRALSSTCTHLGCRVSYDAGSKQIKCPCHGGVYNAEGQVLAGPPPAPLPQFTARVDGTDVYIQV